MKKLLFTDLDGTLLDHHSYDYRPALPAIRALEKSCIPWIMTTSKTAAEVIQLREQLGNHYAFIVENGAGIFWPTKQLETRWLPSHSELAIYNETFSYLCLNSMPLNEALQLLHSYRKQLDFKFIGFSEMTVDQVAEFTGLPLDQAALAKQREFTEPLLWQDSDNRLLQLQEMLAEHQLQLVRGGRFVHLMGTSNKGQALEFLKQYYQQAWQAPVQTMALGDGNNDIPLLEASDCPVIIRSPQNSLPKVEHSNVLVPQGFGPEAWNQAVLQWLTDDQSQPSIKHG